MAGHDTHPPLPPYLGGWALASLAFTSPVVLSLLLVILRLVLSIKSANASIASAKQNLASGCNSLEQAASVAVSIPHYMAANFNNVTADGAEAMLHGLGTVLDMSVLGIEQITLFIVDTYRSMYLCLADLVVRGSMSLAVDATEEFSSFLNSTFSAVRSEVQTAISGVDSILASAVSTVNKIPGVDIDTPTISVPSLDFLNNVTLPSDFLTSLNQLNSSLPTLDEIRDKMNSIITIPFEDLRTEINGTLKNATVDRSLLPVPGRESLAFCQDLDLSFVDDVGHSLVKVAEYGIIAIILVILLFIAAMVFKELRFYKSLGEYIDSCRAVWVDEMAGQYHAIRREDADRILSKPTLLGFLTTSSNPLLRWLAQGMNRVQRLRSAPRTRSNITWFVAYITYLPALLLLLVAVLGLLSIEIQLAALKPTEASAQKQVDSGLSGFRAQILAKINDATQNKSAEYATASNIVLSDLEDGINNGMFGWTNTTTVTLNTTLNEFYDDLTGAITSTFGNTVFAAPALDVVNCLIGTKIAGISTALTWLHDNAHVTLPKVDDNIFSLSDASSQDLMNTLDNSSGSSSGGPTSIVHTLVDQYRNALEKERLGFIFLLCLYLLVVVMGVAAVLWHELVTPRVRRRKSRETLKELYLEKSVNKAGISPMNQQLSSRSIASGAIARLRGAVGIFSISGRRVRASSNASSFANNASPVARNSSGEESSEKATWDLAFSPPSRYPFHITGQQLSKSNISRPMAYTSSDNLLQQPCQPEDATSATPVFQNTRHTPPLPRSFPEVAYRSSEYVPPTRALSNLVNQRQPSNPFHTPFDAPSESWQAH